MSFSELKERTLLLSHIYNFNLDISPSNFKQSMSQQYKNKLKVASAVKL
jgi:hypothetical protein